jgi:hypothetical protein
MRQSIVPRKSVDSKYMGRETKAKFFAEQRKDTNNMFGNNPFPF